MRIQDVDDKDILTEDVELWQYKLMADYSFIIQKLFEIIPPA